MSELEYIKQQLEEIQKRNIRVEKDKAWETSLTRKISIMVLTYFVVVLFFWISWLGNPFINAIVPTMWFMLSTFSLPLFKSIWLKYLYKNK